MKYLALILSNLKRHKLRTVLTMLSILVAFLLFGYLAAIRTAFTAGIDVADLDRLIVRHKVSLVNLLPAAYEQRMERIEGVQEALGQTWFGGYYQEQRNQFAQMPVKPDEFIDMYPEFQRDYEKHQKRFEHPQDNHWSGYGHEIVADRIAESSWFRNAFECAGGPDR